MPRRPASDDAALAAAYRRLDRAAPAAQDAPMPIDAHALAEAERIDAALRGLFQPVAAPESLAGRIAGELGRARARRWRHGPFALGRQGGTASRRPVWAMGLAAAVVVAMLAGIGLAATGGGGTIGERARGVGAWVRDVLGVGVWGEGGAGKVDDASYYWVPGMGILPLEPDAVAATGPVTATVDGRDWTIEGLVSDARGTQLSVRRGLPRDGKYEEIDDSSVFHAVSLDGRTDFRSCSLMFTGPDICSLNPLTADERREGFARLFVPPRDAGLGDDWYPLPADGDYAGFLRQLHAIQVPVASVASGVFARAHRLGADQVRGGLRLRAWAVEPTAGYVAVRVETIDVAKGSAVRFVQWSDQDFWKLDPSSGIRLRIGSGQEQRPTTLWRHADGDDRVPNGLPVGWEHAPAVATTAQTSTFRVISGSRDEFPMTLGFRVAGGSVGKPMHVVIGPLFLAIDAEYGPPSLEGPNSTTMRVDTVAATYAVTRVTGALGQSGLPAERYPVTRTFRFADRTRLLGIGVVIDPGSPRPPNPQPSWVLHPPRAVITVRWSDDGSDGRQLVQMYGGYVVRGSLKHWLERTCYPFAMGGGGDSGDGETTGSSPERWMTFGGAQTDILSSVTLCLSRPIFRIPGPWTFPLDRP